MDERFRDLSPKRQEHSLRVAEVARRLAPAFGGDPELAYEAGLYHDLFRERDPSWLQEEARRLALPLDPADMAAPVLLHGPVAARHLRSRLGDAGADAVRYHTYGTWPMDGVVKAVYLADKVEPGRRYQGVEALRTAIRAGDATGALSACIAHQLSYLISSKYLLPADAVRAYNGTVLPMKGA